MAFDGVLAFQGRDHITASQLGRIVEGVAGKGRYVLPTLHRLKATMQTANKVRVDTGDLVMDGRVVTNEAATDLVVESGTSGYKRNDLVVCFYAKDASTGVERFDAKVLKGTPTTGKPADPKYDAGDISAGSATAVMPLWRIPINGITPGMPVQVADTAQSLKALGESVSQTETYSSGAVHVERRGRVCVASASMLGMPAAVGSWTSGVIGTLPDGFRPASTIGGTAFVEADTNRIVPIAIEPSGLIRVLTRGVSFGKGALFSYSVAYLV